MRSKAKITGIEISFKTEVVCTCASVFFNNLNFFKVIKTINVLRLAFSGISLSIGIKMFLQNLGKTKKMSPFPRQPPATANYNG